MSEKHFEMMFAIPKRNNDRRRPNRVAAIRPLKVKHVLTPVRHGNEMMKLINISFCVVRLIKLENRVRFMLNN